MKSYRTSDRCSIEARVVILRPVRLQEGTGTTGYRVGLIQLLDGGAANLTDHLQDVVNNAGEFILSDGEIDWDSAKALDVDEVRAH